MSQNQTTENTTETTAEVAGQAAGQAARSPSKKSQALAIFQANMELRAAGKFDSNKAFRAKVLAEIQEQLGVSVASAATMYNTAKKDAEAANPEVGLGRDPKKEKVKTTGKRGRPAGSKNKEKVTVAVDTTALQGTEEGSGYAAPAAEAAPAAAPVDLSTAEPALM